MIWFFVVTPIAIALWGGVAWGLHWLWEHRAGRVMSDIKLAALKAEADTKTALAAAETAIYRAKRGY